MDKLHQEAFVLDSHCDTPSMLLENVDLGKRLDRCHVDFQRMKEGGVDGSFFAIYTSNSLTPDAATRRALELISRTYDAVDQNRDKVAFAFSVEEALENKKKGLISIFLGMENGLPIQKDLHMLRLFYRFGVRYMTLTHAGNNEICDSCGPKEKRWGGVSPFGQEVIAEMNRLGMIIDVSHISDDAFYDVIKYSKAPVAATHSCCRALCGHRRNMTDDMIKALAENDGVIQINFYPAFIDDSFASDEFSELADDFDAKQFASRMEPDNDEKRAAYHEVEKKLANFPAPSYKRVVDHIDHVVKLVGAKHVGLGSDFDGIETPPEGVRDISKFPLFTEELKARGYSDEDIKGILGGNFLRVMKRVEEVAAQLQK
ncbi:MAG: dipeptidase [Bacteroidales bacterium]|nr:dipeptidase [Bacteroidales bacterium]